MLTPSQGEELKVVTRWLNLADAALGAFPTNPVSAGLFGEQKPNNEARSSSQQDQSISTTESELKIEQSQQMAQEARKRWMRCQARAEELTHQAERLYTHAQQLKDGMNEAANRAKLRIKAAPNNG